MRACVRACVFVVLSFFPELVVLGFGGTTDGSLSHPQFWALRGGVVGPGNSSYTQAVSRTKILADRILCPGATVREHRPRRALCALYILVDCAWWGYRVRPTQYVRFGVFLEMFRARARTPVRARPWA